MATAKKCESSIRIKKGDLTDIFGTLKTKLTGQQLKDLARKDWESSSDRKFMKK